MAAPDVGACVSAGYNGFKKDPVTHIVATLLVIIIGNVSAGLLLGPMIVGYMRLIKIQEDGGTPQIGDVFKGFDDFVPALLAGLVSGILVAIGFMLCILPGLLIMATCPPPPIWSPSARRTASTRSSAHGWWSSRTCSAPSSARWCSAFSDKSA